RLSETRERRCQRGSAPTRGTPRPRARAFRPTAGGPLRSRRAAAGERLTLPCPASYLRPRPPAPLALARPGRWKCSLFLLLKPGPRALTSESPTNSTTYRISPDLLSSCDP